MRLIYSISIMIFTFSLLTIFPSYSESCEEGAAVFSHAMQSPPDEMTLEYLNSALELCVEKSSLYKDAARYYKDWSKKEINPDKQKEYKALAITFYNKALGKKTTGNNSLQGELASLQNTREFNKVAFRALQPSAPGAVNTGLNMYITFRRNSYELTNGFSTLDELGEAMKENVGITVSLEGHTDMTGTQEYNYTLSLNRAESAKDYITEKFNIQPERIQTSGYGYRYLMDKNNPTGTLNRRVEVIKLSN